MTKCDFCAESMPDGTCTVQAFRGYYCECAIQRMCKVVYDYPKSETDKSSSTGKDAEVQE